MMKDKREKWISDVFNSLQGSRRAQPPEDLFGRLEQRLWKMPEAKVRPLLPWRLAAVAAVLLLTLNVLALQQFSQSPHYQSEEWGEERLADPALISNYKLYE